MITKKEVINADIVQLFNFKIDITNHISDVLERIFYADRADLKKSLNADLHKAKSLQEIINDRIEIVKSQIVSKNYNNKPVYRVNVMSYFEFAEMASNSMYLASYGFTEDLNKDKDKYLRKAYNEYLIQVTDLQSKLCK